jgi:hypothetical protein
MLTVPPAAVAASPTTAQLMRGDGECSVAVLRVGGWFLSAQTRVTAALHLTGASNCCVHAPLRQRQCFHTAHQLDHDGHEREAKHDTAAYTRVVAGLLSQQALHPLRYKHDSSLRHKTADVADGVQKRYVPAGGCKRVRIRTVDVRRVTCDLCRDVRRMTCAASGWSTHVPPMAGSPMRVKKALMEVKVTAPARLLHTAAPAMREKYQRGSPFSFASAGHKNTTKVPKSDMQSRPTKARVHCFRGRCWSVMRPTMNAKAISNGNRATAIFAKASLLTPRA